MVCQPRRRRIAPIGDPDRDAPGWTGDGARRGQGAAGGLTVSHVGFRIGLSRPLSFQGVMINQRAKHGAVHQTAKPPIRACNPEDIPYLFYISPTSSPTFI